MNETLTSIDDGKGISVNLRLNNETLATLISKGIEELPKETIHQLAYSALSEALKDKDVLNNLLFCRKEHSYGWDTSEVRGWIVEMLAGTFSKEEVKEFREKILEVLKKNHRDVVVDALARTFTDNLFGATFQQNVIQTIRDEMHRENSMLQRY